MIITCPSCGASFNVKPEALGPQGRSVKCSKCAHRWHATADESESESRVTEPAPAPAPQPEPEPEAPVAPEAEALPTDESDPPSEKADAPTAATPDTDDAAPAAVPPLPPGMREALGIAPDSAETDTGTDNADTRGRRRRAPRATARTPRRNMARVLSIFVLLLVVCGAGSAVVLMKNDIMMWLPASQRLYAMIGIGPAALGHGLQIAEPTPRKEIDGNDEILVVEGEVRNLVDEAVDVPLMRGALLDAKGKPLHIWTFTATKSRIAPGENVRYRTEFRNPPTEAQSLDITFTRPETEPEGVEPEPKDESGMMTNSTARQH